MPFIAQALLVIAYFTAIGIIMWWGLQKGKD